MLIASSGGTKIDPSKLAKVEKGDLAKSVVATGKIEPITKVEVKSKASGIVKKLYVEYGDRVKKGQVLAELDREEIQARVDQARAQVEASERQFEWDAGRPDARESRCRGARRSAAEASL